MPELEADDRELSDKLEQLQEAISENVQVKDGESAEWVIDQAIERISGSHENRSRQVKHHLLKSGNVYDVNHNGVEEINDSKRKVYLIVETGLEGYNFNLLQEKYPTLQVEDVGKESGKDTLTTMISVIEVTH